MPPLRRLIASAWAAGPTVPASRSNAAAPDTRANSAPGIRPRRAREDDACGQDAVALVVRVHAHADVRVAVVKLFSLRARCVRLGHEAQSPRYRPRNEVRVKANAEDLLGRVRRRRSQTATRCGSLGKTDPGGSAGHRRERRDEVRARRDAPFPTWSPRGRCSRTRCRSLHRKRICGVQSRAADCSGASASPAHPANKKASTTAAGVLLQRHGNSLLPPSVTLVGREHAT